MKFIFIILMLAGMIFCIPVFFGDRRYKKAQGLEKKGKYKDACYEYAIAILNGSFATGACRKRIKYLWEKYGPFDYADVLEEVKKDDSPEKCDEAGHFLTVSIIEETVTLKK